jgi:hypothetical protein
MVTARKCLLLWCSIFLFLVGACVPAGMMEPVAERLPADSVTPESYPRYGVVWPTSTYPPGPYPPPTSTPWPELSEPTDLPEPTDPPIPTLPPTPVVTPIPTAAPPIIPLPEGATPEAFTLHYREGNVIRSLSSRGGEEATVFLDPAKEFGLYLAPEYAPFPFRDWGELSPDGRLVALALAEVPESADPNYEGYSTNVYILDQESREFRLLAKNAVEPVWSPDGRRLAYLSSADWSLWVTDIESGKTVEVYTPDRNRDNPHNVRGHTWAPDSRRLALIDDLPRQMNALIAVDVEQPDAIRNLVEFTLYPMGNPQWSPTGESVAVSWYAGEGGEGPHLWKIDVVDGAGTQMTKDINVDGNSPQWSPDGRWIAVSGFVPYERETALRDIWLVNAHSGDIRRLTAGAEMSGDEVHSSRMHPAWSPSGSEITYIKLLGEEDRREIWSLSLLDGSQRRLVDVGRPFDIGLELTYQRQAGG